MDQPGLDRILTLELVRVAERAAVAAARLRGRGDEMAADQAAVDAMRQELNRLPIAGTVVIGEGERDEAPMLYIGEEVGTKQGPDVDIALDPWKVRRFAPESAELAGCYRHRREGQSALCARCLHGKDCCWSGLSEGRGRSRCNTDRQHHGHCKAKGVKPHEITACIMDRPRHARLIEEVRATGASIRLIGDGDVAGVMHTTNPDETGIDIYIGIGGAPEGVLAAAALRCIGGQMQGRLQLNSDEKIARAAKMGISDPKRSIRWKRWRRATCFCCNRCDGW